MNQTSTLAAIAKTAALPGRAQILDRLARNGVPRPYHHIRLEPSLLSSKICRIVFNLVLNLPELARAKRLVARFVSTRSRDDKTTCSDLKLSSHSEPLRVSAHQLRTATVSIRAGRLQPARGLPAGPTQRGRRKESARSYGLFFPLFLEQTACAIGGPLWLPVLFLRTEAGSVITNHFRQALVLCSARNAAPG